MKLVKLGKCLHIRSEKDQKFVKLSAKNLREALNISNPNVTKREMIKAWNISRLK